MSFMDLIRRGDSSDKAFDDLQSDMAEAFDESMALEDLSASDADKENSKPAADIQLLSAPNGSASAEEAHLPVTSEPMAAAMEPSSQAVANGELPVAADTVSPV